jgi:murein L,D-transpeptidase YafK
MLAVDKSSQQLYLVTGDTPLRIAASYVCTTGQVKGDKRARGDLKTPEGVYFIVNHLSSGLDYTLYGNEAYPLNYPNPVDKLRRKTGYGIWLHGRGEQISPLQTQGCIALNNGDLSSLGKFLQPGTPVTLTETYHQRETAPAQDAATINLLRTRVTDWAKTWSARSLKLFDFYDKDAYSIAQEEPFAVFQKQKERLFRTLPWIKTTVSEIQILPGPGYWVTWFYQEYSAPNLSTQGVRRLYWQQNKGGEWKIVGMEWIPGTTTSLLLAEKPFPAAAERIDERREGGGQPISEEQAVPLPEALAAAERSRTTEARALAASAAGNTLTPEERVVMPGQESDAAEAPVLSEAAASDIPSGPTAAKTQNASSPPLDHVEDPSLGKMAEPPQAAALRAALAAADSALPQKQAAPNPPGLPSAIPSDADLRLPPALPAQRLATGNAPDSPTPRTPEAAASAALSPEALIRERVENWRKAWQHGDLERYSQFYAPQAIQENRTSAEAIRRHKRALWGRAAPKRVDLTDIRISLDGNTATAIMRQRYSDAQGRGDKGIKTLVWEKSGQMWRIIKETWSPEP